MPKPITKILVVGGAGYIGGSVVDSLVKRNLPFTVYDNLLYEHQYLKPVDFIYGDIRDTDKLFRILANYSHVVWLAAIVGDAACQVSKVTGCGIEWSEEKSEDPRSYRASTEKIKQAGLFNLSEARSIEYGIKEISNLEESENDAFRFPYDYWGKDVWEVKSF